MATGMLANRRKLRSTNLISHVIILPGGGGTQVICVVHICDQKNTKKCCFCLFLDWMQFVRITTGGLNKPFCILLGWGLGKLFKLSLPSPPPKKKKSRGKIRSSTRRNSCLQVFFHKGYSLSGCILKTSGDAYNCTTCVFECPPPSLFLVEKVGMLNFKSYQ